MSRTLKFHARTTRTTDHWGSPDEVLERVRAIAPIALDPCAGKSTRVGAKHHYTGAFGSDGLVLTWQRGGLVYANPPYGRALLQWALKATAEALLGAELVFLAPSRLDTQWAALLLEHCNAWVTWRGRLRFVATRGRVVKRNTAPFPASLWYFGPRPLVFGAAFADRCHVFAPPNRTARSRSLKAV